MLKGKMFRLKDKIKAEGVEEEKPKKTPKKAETPKKTKKTKKS